MQYFFKCICLLILSGLHAGQAAGFPNQPVTIVVPFAAGGSSDMIARLVGAELSKKWNQPVVIEAKPGGQTVIATNLVAKSRPDGYTILFNSFALVTNQLLMKDLPYQTSELMPVTLLGRYPLALIVRSTFPANNLQEFIAYARQSPHPITFGNAGMGSSMQIGALDFANQTGINIVEVPYKGSISAMNEVMGGQIDAIFEGQAFKQYADGQRAKALFIAQADRKEGWEVPSAVEAGLPEFAFAAWFGLMLPADTPREIVQKISADVGEIIKREDVRKRLGEVGLVADGMTPEKYTAYLHSEYQKLKKLLTTSGAIAP